LESAIKELDSFSYSVSHDLRSPLRAIDGWSLALIEDYGEKLDDIAIGYINRMRSESKRMGNLIDDLLSLSKIGKRQIVRKQINYKDLCLLIINRIIEAEQYKQPEVIIHDNHFIYADENLLDILITNLISNALKFSSKKENPKIEIGVELIDDLPFYYIKDNGVGFEMNNENKLFGAFQRMHKKSEFSGTGIGLATVKRIVTLHGGTIFAKSKINEGAAFCFNLNYNTNT
jgi:light-regulated signal transduction histidine kinase (bacteriophytochrome)